MRLTLESTSLIVDFTQNGQTIPVRVWRGYSDAGIEVAAFIATVSPQTHEAAAHEQFKAELSDITGSTSIAERPINIRQVM